MCDIANVSKSGYYKWLNNKNKISVQEILEVIYIKEIFSRKDRVYGIRTIKMKLEQDYGIVINRKKIARIMKENNLITKTRKQKPYSKQKVNQEQLISENIVSRNFKDRTALEAFGIDITYLKYNNKFAYLCVLQDMKTTEVISYKTGTNYSTSLVLSTVTEGLINLPKEIVQKAIIHSDRGSQFTSKAYKDLLEYFGITQSMSLPANPRDNAVIESFFGHMKDEINLKKVKTFDEVVDIIDEYMYDYNNNRKQWNKDRMTPIEYRQFLVA